MAQEFLAKMESILEEGGEAALERYIIDHFEELPKEVQSKALFGFVRETVEGAVNIADIQEQGIAAMEAIDRMREEVKKTA